MGSGSAVDPASCFLYLSALDPQDCPVQNPAISYRLGLSYRNVLRDAHAYRILNGQDTHKHPAFRSEPN